MGSKINRIGQKYGHLTVIDYAQNIKNETAWKCLCDCGNECIKTSHYLVSNKNPNCGCKRKKDITGQRYGILTVIKPTTERKHGSVVWECKCDCGNICYATTESLRVGDRKSCGCLLEQSRKNLGRYGFTDLTGQQFGQLTVLELTDLRNNAQNRIWKCKCKCGNICYVSTNHLQTGNTKSCGCLGSQSTGELEIKELLEHYHIPFKSQYVFSDLPNRKYDFAIFTDITQSKIDKLIEFDGEQHYYEVPHFHTSLIEQQKIDNIKTQFAQDKNIKLIRIPYWKRGNIT